MLNPTVRENLLFPSSSPSARYRRRFPQVQSMVAYEANYLRIYKGRVHWHKQNCFSGILSLIYSVIFILSDSKLILYQFFTIILPPRFDTTSKITAARRTTPFTTFCMLASTPISDIPRLITPIRTAPTITPGTVPIPP